MLEYEVSINPQGGVVIQGDFAPGSYAVNLPDENPKKRQFISLFLNNHDIELSNLLQEIRKYTIYLIDKNGESIAKDYSDRTRNELSAFGKLPFKLATTDTPEKSR